MIRQTPDSPDGSTHNSRAWSQVSVAGPSPPALRPPGLQALDLAAGGKGSHEGWSAVGSRLSLVTVPMQAMLDMTPPGSPDATEPILAKWPLRG